MAITYHSGERIQGLSYLSTQQDLTTGTTDAGTNSTIRGFGNQIRSGHAIVGSTLTKVEVSFKTAGAGTATVGVWDSSNNLKLTLGTKDLSTLTGSEAYYTFDTGSVIMQADWIIGFQISGTASNTSVTVRTNGSPDVANVDSYYYHSSNGWNPDGATREYNMKIHYNNGDEKPTNVQLGSRYEETDTRKVYNYKESDTIESSATYQYTSITGGQTIANGGYEISAQKIVNSSSELVGEKIGRIDVPMKYFSGTGTVTAGVFNSSGNTLHTFGTKDISTVSTSTNPYIWYSFTGTSSYTLSAGEYVGVKLDNGSGSISIPHRDSGTQYDGSNSHWDRWNGSWSASFTNLDQNIKLYVVTTGGTFAWQEIGA